MTCGTSRKMPPACPAKLAYQVCECSRSTPSLAATIARETPMVCSEALAPARVSGT